MILEKQKPRQETEPHLTCCFPPDHWDVQCTRTISVIIWWAAWLQCVPAFPAVQQADSCTAAQQPRFPDRTSWVRLCHRAPAHTSPALWAISSIVVKWMESVRKYFEYFLFNNRFDRKQSHCLWLYLLLDSAEAEHNSYNNKRNFKLQNGSPKIKSALIYTYSVFSWLTVHFHMIKCTYSVYFVHALILIKIIYLLL